MKANPNVSPEQLARLRAEDEQLRPILEAEMPAVREEWRQYVKSLTGVVSRHSSTGGVPRACEQRKLCHIRSCS